MAAARSNHHSPSLLSENASEYFKMAKINWIIDIKSRDSAQIFWCFSCSKKIGEAWFSCRAFKALFIVFVTWHFAGI